MQALKRTRALLCGILAVTALAQTPEFEVASVKLNTSGAEPAVRVTPGRLTVQALTLNRLILVAYKVRGFQVSGASGWIDSGLYDIDGKTDAGNDGDRMLLMLQRVLEDRFGLKFHREIKDGPVYLLTRGKSAEKMQKADCVPRFDSRSLVRRTGAPEQPDANSCGGIDFKGNGPDRSLDGRGMPMEDQGGLGFQSLAGQLSLLLDRPVLNKTGLEGLFEVHLHWSSEQDGPSIFTAVQEQPGLKLDSGRGPVEHMVIDHAERPSDN
jgi:uncharacterized protein (TIGR03435 family)